MKPAGTAGLILAAGGGTRFGPEPKLLIRLDGRPLLEHAVGALNAVEELDPVVVVLGSQADRLLAEVDFGRARTVVCLGWEAGMSASLRCGLAELPGVQRVIVVLGDSPTVTPPLLRRFLDAAPGTRATYGGAPGHPVVLGPEQLTRLGELEGDLGARQLLQGGPGIECGDLASGRDVDTAADLEELRSSG